MELPEYKLIDGGGPGALEKMCFNAMNAVAIYILHITSASLVCRVKTWNKG